MKSNLGLGHKVSFVGAVLKEVKREEEIEKQTKEITPPKLKKMPSHVTNTLKRFEFLIYILSFSFQSLLIICAGLWFPISI